jgi:hypothetical protein
MRRLDSYIRKYGPVDGPLLYRRLQREAVHARWKAFYRERSGGRRLRQGARAA